LASLTFLLISQPDALIIQIYSVIKFYIFRAFSLPIIRSFLLYIRHWYRGADKSLARPTSRYILFDGENISFDASMVMYINSTNIPPIMIINTIYEHQNLLSL